MYTDSSPLISAKAIEFIEATLGISLSSAQKSIVIDLEKNQAAFCEIIFKINEPRNYFTVALEAIYYLFFYDFSTRNTKVIKDKNVLDKLKHNLYNSPDSFLIQKTEVVSCFLELIETYE